MEHYAGIDVSLEQSSVCVVDATGRIVREAKVASEPLALIAWFDDLGVPLARVGLEAGPLSQWLYAALRETGLAVELLETRHVRAAFKAMPVKTDRKDARGIAQLMRLGWFRAVHCKSLAAQEVRALLTARKLVQSLPGYRSLRHRFAGSQLQGGGRWTRTLRRVWARRSAPNTLAKPGPHPGIGSECRRVVSRRPCCGCCVARTWNCCHANSA
jgi:transposase